MKKNINFSNTINIFIYIFPILLITGPAIPDIILTTIALLFIFKIFKDKEFYKFNQSWFKAGVLLWLWFIFISFFAYDKYLSFADSIIFIRFLVFILAMQTIIITSENTRINIIKIIFIFTFFVTIDSFYQFFNYDPEFGFLNDILGRKPEGTYGRISGPFKDLVPGSVVSKFFFICLLCIFLNYLNFFKNKLFNIFISILILSLMITIVYCSGERIALATLFLGIIITLITFKSIRKILIFSMILSLIFIILINIFHPIYNDFKIIKSSSRHEGLIIEKEFKCKNSKNELCRKEILLQPKFLAVLKDFKGSAYGEIYNTAYNIWKDNKLFGIGLNNFKSVCNSNNKYDKYHNFYSCGIHPHNFYIQALVESGIIGLLLFISFLFLIFKTIFISNQKKEFKIIFIISLIIIFWPIMSTGSFLKNWHMALISFIIGICLSNPEKNIIKKN